MSDQAVVGRWRGRLAVRRGLLAAARRRHSWRPTDSTRWQVEKRKRQVAEARRVIDRHSQGPANTFPGSPIPGTRMADGSTHQTAGLPGFPAVDYFAKGGSPCVSPVTGRVTKLSGHDPSGGPTGGVHGPFGWSVYIEGNGRTFFLTHMGSRTVQVGDSVKQGERIGTVGNYAKWGGTDHIHQGIHG